MTDQSLYHPRFAQLTIVGFSVKVSSPKSNGRMNRVFVLLGDARITPIIALAGVPGGLASALTKDQWQPDAGVRRVLFSFHILEIS